MLKGVTPHPPSRTATVHSIHDQDEWLWGWDSTPGIGSVWVEAHGHATVWRRNPETGTLVREEERFCPWLLVDRLEDLRHLGERLAPEGTPGAAVRIVNSTATGNCGTWCVRQTVGHWLPPCCMARAVGSAAA
jgi:hypothetical protein